jgi:imidazoleglycerol-phosphate dehydratase / histidinol-phosphatase
MKKILFLDRDGVILVEPAYDFQIDNLSKFAFVPGVIHSLARLARETDYEFVMVTNQDGLGTDSFPEDTFWPCQNLMAQTLENEGVVFKSVHVDRSFSHENLPTRKPGTAMLTAYMTGEYDLANSFVVGDRITDMQLAQNLGAKGILIHNPHHPKVEDTSSLPIALSTDNWEEIYQFLRLPQRIVSHRRTTNETDILIELNLDGTGKSKISTGLGFFDHMLDQLARHGRLDLHIEAKGDLHIDEHHTIEDTALALGEAFVKALGDKRGIERYAAVPMDDAQAHVLLDFGGRPWIVWDTAFQREKVGDMPTEMFFHFFKSFSDASRCNLNIRCEGDNEHHKIEAIFKAWARAIHAAVKRDPNDRSLPSTKGVL